MDRSYSQFFAEVANLLEQTKNYLARSVNAIMSRTYWELGRRIVEHEQQGRRRAGDEWYRVDLPFFHRRLRCLIVIDLKIGRFTQANAGQMNLFLNYARETNRAFRKHGSEPWCAIGTLSPLSVSLTSERPQFLSQLK